MLFSSPFFISVFLPVVLVVYWGFFYCAKKFRITPWNILNSFLLLSSLFFYFWGENWGVFWLIGSIVFNDVIARLISRSVNKHIRIGLLSFDIVGNLVFLGWFKYAGFTATLINKLPFIDIAIPKVALPLGISFYTFQAMSYVIDVYRSEVKPSKGMLNFACYITMFPQLVAGPIVRYCDIETELSSRIINTERIASGLRRFLCGLIKKAIIANSVASFADATWAHFQNGHVVMPELAWLAVICYTLQIYYDFSGYSDMAIGIGRMMGFDFLENFKHPYCATSVRDFWRRWHISLSSWFRDYLYIPLGGNRKGMLRTCFNGMVVFALCGLWHGASTMFIAWGVWHGIFLTMERLITKNKKTQQTNNLLLHLLGHLYTIAVFVLGWVLFRSANRVEATLVFKSLFGLSPADIETRILFIEVSPKLIVTAIIGIVFAYPVFPRFREMFQRLQNPAKNIVYVFLLILLSLAAALAIVFIGGGSYNPFIYFRF